MRDDSDKVPSLLTDYILKGELLVAWYSMLCTVVFLSIYYRASILHLYLINHKYLFIFM